MFKIAVLISGGGTNLQSIIDSINSNYLENCSIEFVISDKMGAFGIDQSSINN